MPIVEGGYSAREKKRDAIHTQCGFAGAGDISCARTACMEQYTQSTDRLT